MGEYAIRKSDGAEIKIGTCEDMYYLRYEDRFKVERLSGNLDPVREASVLRFRLPFPDEDGVLPGDYKDHSRAVRLYRMGQYGAEDFPVPECAINDPGIMQLHHESGLLINVPCYHGAKPPDVGQCKAFWNGKSWFLELSQLRCVSSLERIFPVVHCRHCRNAWRLDWSSIWDYIPADIRPRFETYKQATEEEAEQVTP